MMYSLHRCTYLICDSPMWRSAQRMQLRPSKKLRRNHPSGLVMREQKPGWYGFPAGALNVIRYRSVQFDHSLVCMISQLSTFSCFVNGQTAVGQRYFITSKKTVFISKCFCNNGEAAGLKLQCQAFLHFFVFGPNHQCSVEPFRPHSFALGKQSLSISDRSNKFFLWSLRGQQNAVYGNAAILFRPK